MRSKAAGFGLFLFVSLLVAAGGVLPTTVRAETRAATALTPEAVWDAINAAKDGDIVQLPEGTAVWKSGWNAKHWAKMKAITIRGAGIDKTIIRTHTTRAPGDKAFVINGVEGKPFRITGITFDGTGCPNAGTWRSTFHTGEFRRETALDSSEESAVSAGRSWLRACPGAGTPPFGSSRCLRADSCVEPQRQPRHPLPSPQLIPQSSGSTKGEGSLGAARCRWNESVHSVPTRDPGWPPLGSRALAMSWPVIQSSPSRIPVSVDMTEADYQVAFARKDLAHLSNSRS